MSDWNIPAEAARVTTNEATSVEWQIDQMYCSYFDAFKAKDAVAALAIMSQNFTWKLPDGTSFDRSQTKAAIEEQMASIIQVDEMTAQIHTIAQESDSARVELTEKLIATVTAEDGSTEHLTCSETYRDLWVSTADGWRLQCSELVSSVSTATSN